MPELRHDIFQSQWVIVASDRGKRPIEFQDVKHEVVEPRNCPFCPGNESATPPEITALRAPGAAPNGPGWSVRVTPNRFPALGIEGDINRRARGLYSSMNGIGAHEIIIESPEHDQHLPDMSNGQVEALLGVMVGRMRDLQKDSRFKYITLFKNHGAAAGASQPHPHSQIIATPVTPHTTAIKLKNAYEHFNLTERCLFCDVLDQELHEGDRIVDADNDFVVLCPYASKFPFEMRILPRKHFHDFTQIGPDIVSATARVLRRSLKRMNIALDNPGYNLMVHSTPNVNYEPRRTRYWNTLGFDYHWHMDIVPRLTRIAGFELSTGFTINPTPPEEAAKFLREIVLS